MTEDQAEGIWTQIHDGVMWVLFDRPETRNALTTAMYQGLHESCLRADVDDSVRCVVIGSAPHERRSFAAGSDISAVGRYTTWEQYRDYEDGITEIITMIQTLKVPTIAAISGPCVGAGATIALASDIRVVGESTRLGYPMARTTGGCLPTPTYVLLAAHVGISRALDMLLAAKLLDAKEVEAAGLASTVVPDDVVDDTAAALARRLSRHAPLSMAVAKEEMRRIRERLIADSPDDLRRAVFESADYREGIEAFVANRAPVWSGR